MKLALTDEGLDLKLRRLYQRRRKLVTAKHLGKLTTVQSVRLGAIETLIDELERIEERRRRDTGK